MIIKPPLTKKQAEDGVYGDWAGNPQGRKFTPDQCAYELWPDRYPSTHQCTQKPGHGPADLYCKQHAKMVERKK